MVRLCEAIFVDETRSWLPELIERSKKLKVNGGFEPGVDLCGLVLVANLCGH